MAKKIIKGNNWKQWNWKSLINQMLPVLCIVLALRCIAGSMMMKQSKNSTTASSASEKTVFSQKTYVSEETDSSEETDCADVTEVVERTDAVERADETENKDADAQAAEEGETAKVADSEIRTGPAEEPEISEAVYTSQKTQVFAENNTAAKSDDTKKSDATAKADNPDNPDTAEDADDEEQAEIPFYEIVNEVENTELTGKATAKENAAYTATLKAAEGYMLPKKILIVMGDEGTEVKEVSYDPETGKLRIPAGTIQGDLTLSGSAELILYYSVTSKINNSILYGTSADTQKGYSATIVPNAGYSLPAEITATSDSEPFVDFTYDALTGKITVAPAAMKGNLIFSGECAPSIWAEKYEIIASIGHGKAEIKEDSTASAMEIVIVPDKGYECPEELIVISGDKQFTDFSYDKESGKLSIGYGKVSRVIISGVCNDTKTSVKYLGERSALPVSGDTRELSGKIDNPFVDVKETDYFCDPVLWAVQKGITTGVDEQHFAPRAHITRGQVVAFLWRAAGCPEPKGTTDKFTDIPAKGYYANAVEWAVERGITDGMADTKFCPEDVCTRGQIVTFLARFAGIKDAQTETTFADVKPTEFFAAAVKWAKDNGITEGETSTTFAPYAECYRADVVTFLYRFLTK